MHIELVDPSRDWADYELIDCGDFEKLERWGNIITSRPEPQAVWPKSLSEKEWNDQVQHTFKRDKNNPEKGIWSSKQGVPQQWFVNYANKGLQLKFRLGLTAFKHVGLFPEQSYNWDYIYTRCLQIPNAKVLNLFAYTGGASLAAKAAKADVTHVDSVKQVINWSKENMEASSLSQIRWMVDDAVKFCQR
ncbi:MAG TPA: class I SAM-dependent methyltransferase, partial [Cytophagales bacterium]|nr:class I SAM-dependent methyltransferase [Cytophagales bacterium]